MKKTKLTLMALLSLTLLAGCDNKTNSPVSKPSSTISTKQDSTSTKPGTDSAKPSADSAKPSTDSTKPSTGSQTPSIPSTPSTPAIKKATIRKVINMTDGILNVQEASQVEFGDLLISVTYEDKDPDLFGIDILVNSVVDTMTVSEDGLSYTYHYTVNSEEDITIAVVNKAKTSKSGETITFAQGEHYKVLGITSGEKYHPYMDYETFEQVTLYFAVIAEDGYYISDVVLKTEYGQDSLKKNSAGYYYTDYLYADSELIVTCGKMENHTISYVGATAENHVNLSSSTLPTAFLSGTEVHFSVIPEDGYSISSVTFSDESITSPDNFSSFDIVLPSVDLTVTIETVAMVNIEYEANAHVKNVKFYSGLTYSDDYETATPKDEITKFLPSDRNSFYTVFEVDSGYKVKDIIAADGSESVNGYDYGVKTTDGKYIFNTYMTSPAKLKFNVLEKKSVALNSAITNAELLFENDITDFFEGDSVNFNVLKTGTDNQKLVKVTESHMKDGSLVKSEISERSYGDYSYSFTMPDSDVTIDLEFVEVHQTTLSYTNNAGNLVKNVRVYGQTSSTELNSETATSDAFEVGETASLTINAGSDHSKKVKASFVGEDNSITPIELSLSIEGGMYTGSFTVTKKGNVFVEAGEASTKRTVTLGTGTQVEYYTGLKADSKVTDLGDLYDMDVFYFAVTNKPAEGNVQSVNLTRNGVKAELYDYDLDDGTKVYKVTINGDIRIETSEMEAVGFNIIDKSDYFGDNSEDKVFLDPDTYEPIEIFDGKYVAKGTKFFVDDTTYFYLVSITIGGQAAKGTEDDVLGITYYEATADVVVTIDMDW